MCASAHLDTRRDEEIHEDALELGLARLEVAAGEWYAALGGQLDQAGDQRVLGAPVDVRAALEDSGHTEQGRWTELSLVAAQGGK